MMQRTQRLLLAALGVGLCVGLAGCPDTTDGPPPTMSADASPDTPAADVSPDDGPPAGPIAHNISRLTPEQVSQQLAVGLDIRFYSEDPRYGNDVLLSPDFAIPLGGVDFRIATHRNHETRLQTLLVSRAVAWLGALSFLGREFENPQMLTCTGMTCVPPETLGGSPPSAWETQARDLHWRMFNRPATADELADLADLYRAALQHEVQPLLAWNAVTYALMSTAEFWHR